MKHFLSSTLLICFFASVPYFTKAQYLVDSEYLSTTPSFVLGAIQGIPAEFDVAYYKLTYNTVNTAGEPTIASGAVAIPETTTCNNFPMVAYCHGTVLRQLDVPSEENVESFLVKIFASTGFIAVAPDYIGLGSNAGIHPYVHAESEATATIDLIRATREFLETRPEQDNGEVFITGYSQGGQAAMAALKYADENGLNEELGIVAGAPCSGPYNLSGSQADVLLSGQPYSNPGYVIYLLISYQLAYGNLYANLSDIIQSPYDEIVAPYFNGVQNTYDMNVVNALLPNGLSDLLVDTVYANFQSNPNHPLWLNLEDNDTYNWTPQVPLRMFYCTGDEQVNYENSLTADSTMNANGAEDVESINSQSGASHAGCIFPALTDAYEFFASQATPCDFVSGIAEIDLRELEIFPNPTAAILNVTIPDEKGTIRIHNMQGKTVFESSLRQGVSQLDVSNLVPSLYVVSFHGDKNTRRSTVVIQ